MKVIGLDGKTYTLKMNEAGILDENRSSFHLKCRELLKELYPLDRIFEEVSLPGSNKLTADFLIPLRRLLIEVHGIQHYQYSSHFHKDKSQFFKGKSRDTDKKKWAELNNWFYVELDGRLKPEEWKNIIIGVFQ